MGDPDEPTVKDRPASGAPTVDIVRGGAKITESSTSASAFDPPGERFEPRGELGRGGMGRVDEAFDRALGREVAIKHMLSHSDVDLARFEREARITARLEHPGIVPIHDAGRSADGTPYYVMRRVDGQPLSELVDGKPLADRLRLVPNILAACDATGFAHARGIVHRDIKPTNILIGPFGETLLIDWGLAREVESREAAAPSQPPSDPSLTRAGTVAGTPGFMSPEQARGETVDARADVFALGATLFYVLSGKLPWHGGSTEMIDHVGAGRPADWRLMPRDVPPDLRAIVEKAMAPNLVDRYPDATALAADLRRFTVGNLVAAYEYGPIARLARFIRRHRGAVLVGLISFLVLVIVGVISVRRVVAERDDANAARKLAEARQREARTAADRMLVTHARELVETDPVDAIAALRTLAPDSASWREAWSVAMAASLKGIPFGFVANSREPALVQIASDDRRAYSVGLRTGHLKIIDIPSRTQRDLVALGPIHSATWFDPTHILITTAGEVALFDVDSGVRRKVLEGNVVTYSDRQGRAVFAVDRTLLELTDPAGTPRLIERDVDEYDPSPDLRAAMIRHGRQRVFLSGGKTYPVPDLPGEVLRVPSTDIALVRDHLVARWRDNIVTIWDLRDDKLVERGHWEQPKDMQSLAYTDGNVYMVTSSYYQRVGSTLPPVRGPLNMSFSTRDGFLIAGSDGSVWIRDSEGVFRLGARHARYTRLDSAIDGRFIIAATQTGEVLLWDVSAVRPRSFLLERNEEPLMLDPTALWTTVNAIGVFRIDRRTGARTVVADGLAPMLSMAVDVSVPLLVLHDEQSGVLRLVRPGFPDVVEPGVEFFGHGERSVVFVNGANELVQWTPESRERITTLSGRATIVAVRAGYIAVVLDDTQLLRIETPTGRQERTIASTVVSDVAIDADGTLWFIAGGAAFRWARAGAAPVPLTTPETVDAIQLVGSRALFHGARSLLLWNGSGESRLIALSSVFATPIDGDLVATRDAQGNVSVVDVVSGSSFQLPITQDVTTPYLTSPGEVAGVYWALPTGEHLIGVYKLTVPREPEQLRRWLVDVTNAKPVPDSDAVAWP